MTHFSQITNVFVSSNNCCFNYFQLNCPIFSIHLPSFHKTSTRTNHLDSRQPNISNRIIIPSHPTQAFGNRRHRTPTYSHRNWIDSLSRKHRRSQPHDEQPRTLEEPCHSVVFDEIFGESFGKLTNYQRMLTRCIIEGP